MDRKHIAIAAVVVVVAFGGIAAAVVTGFGPLPGGDSGNADASTPYENTVVVGDSGDSDSGGDGNGGADSGDSGSTATATSQPPFSFVIQNIEKCGQTCRVVNASIVNQQDSAAEDVTVRSEIYTGGDKIWQGSSEAGTLASGETYTDTKRVELSYGEAYKVQQNDGKITIKTFVRTSEQTYVFTEERDVS